MLRKGADGALTCGEGAALRPGEALTVRQKFDCNSASAEELAAVLGATLARRFVEARDGGFQSWEQVDAVPGLGPERLLKLQAACEIRVADGGVW